MEIEFFCAASYADAPPYIGIRRTNGSTEGFLDLDAAESARDSLDAAIKKAKEAAVTTQLKANVRAAAKAFRAWEVDHGNVRNGSTTACDYAAASAVSKLITGYDTPLYGDLITEFRRAYGE